MGCGKTTHGKKLARVLDYTFLDLDDLITQKEQQSINDLFANKGEQAFRNLETETLKEIISRNDSTVISLGGGLPCFNNNLELLKTNGFLVYIQMPAKALFNRLVNSKEERPLLKNKTNEELIAYIEELLGKREDYYNQAHLIVDGINLDVVMLKEQIQNFDLRA